MNTIELEEGWVQIYAYVERLINGVWSDDLECWGPGEQGISNKEYITGFTLVYQMSTQEPPHNYSEQLYSRYEKIHNDVFTQNVVPKIDVAPDNELVIQEQWGKYKIFTRWMGNFFSYLDRFYTKRQDLPPVKDMGMRLFKEHLRDNFSDERIDAMIQK